MLEDGESFLINSCLVLSIGWLGGRCYVVLAAAFSSRLVMPEPLLVVDAPHLFHVIMLGAQDVVRSFRRFRR